MVRVVVVVVVAMIEATWPGTQCWILFPVTVREYNAAVTSN